jgi:hypothetical protein
MKERVSAVRCRDPLPTDYFTIRSGRFEFIGGPSVPYDRREPKTSPFMPHTTGRKEPLSALRTSARRSSSRAPKFLAERKIQGAMMGGNRFGIDMPRYIDYYQQERLNLDDMISKRTRFENVSVALGASRP